MKRWREEKMASERVRVEEGGREEAAETKKAERKRKSRGAGLGIKFSPSRAVPVISRSLWSLSGYIRRQLYSHARTSLNGFVRFRDC